MKRPREQLVPPGPRALPRGRGCTVGGCSPCEMVAVPSATPVQPLLLLVGLEGAARAGFGPWGRAVPCARVRSRAAVGGSCRSGAVSASIPRVQRREALPLRLCPPLVTFGL